MSQHQLFATDRAERRDTADDADGLQGAATPVIEDETEAIASPAGQHRLGFAWIHRLFHLRHDSRGASSITPDTGGSQAGRSSGAGNMNRTSSDERRDGQFLQGTHTALHNIEKRLTKLPLEERYAGAYGVLRGYCESLLFNFAEVFTPEQAAEVRDILDLLENITGENYDLPKMTKHKQDQVAQALQEMEPPQ